ncbi:putative PE-PGRS family protein [Blattamonas nauphoetae]|uniref:PE-PGRS family protein n=1 Tax=Blattamonas nauphoetae TaxID=2049346 RepID=A0ABQ9WUN6_9EUKA|nr:putative PE-PGRS family protein [Blattamonas nauphoetae]
MRCIVNTDYSILFTQQSYLDFLHCLSKPLYSQYFTTLFESFVPFHHYDFSPDAIRMLSLPNAGGHSENSEALSFELIHRMFGATLDKAEMEIHYANEHWKKTDYVCRIKSHRLGVSVTRAVGFPKPENFDIGQAASLLKKKLFGICVSSVGVEDDDKWERQLLHVWCQSPSNALLLRDAYSALHESLRGDTIVILTIAENHKWIFS